MLKPYNKEDESYMTYYFEAQDDDENPKDTPDLGEYDCCDNQKCIDKTMKELTRKYPGEKIEPIRWSNDGDHNKIDHCYQCSRPLNSQLTWIKQELEHHELYSVTKRHLKMSSVAFDVIAMLEAMPTVDVSISDYDRHQQTLGNEEPMKNAMERMEKFVTRVIDYAEMVIAVMGGKRITRYVVIARPKGKNKKLMMISIPRLDKNKALEEKGMLNRVSDQFYKEFDIAKYPFKNAEKR